METRTRQHVPGRLIVSADGIDLGVIQEARRDWPLGDGRRCRVWGWLAIPGPITEIPGAGQPIYRNRAEAVKALMGEPAKLAKERVYS